MIGRLASEKLERWWRWTTSSTGFADEDKREKRTGSPLFSFLRGSIRYIARFFLTCLSYVYRVGVVVRNWAYDRGVFSVYHAEVPVISIGNITLGGAGKTPLVEALARALPGYKVAILSRGYQGLGKKRRSKDPLLVSFGFLEKQKGEGGPLVDVALCGDEPYMLAERLPDAMVIVSLDRIAGVTWAAQMGAEVVLLDDGMQHRRLGRDCDWVVWDGDLSGDLFPRGRLREPLQALQRVDRIWLTQDCELDRSIRHLPIERLSLVFDRKTKEALLGKRVAVYCGLGNPKAFIAMVEEAGGKIVAEKILPDHASLSLEALKRWWNDHQADLLVMTPKDRVKLPSKIDLPILICERVVEETRSWQKGVERVDSMLKKWPKREKSVDVGF